MKDWVLVKLLVNDLRSNKVLNITLFLFVFVSAFLIATGVIAIERLSGSLDQIYSIAEPPHYMQMHVGEINERIVEDFVDESGLVEEFEIQEMINIDGISISYLMSDGNKGTLSSSLFDNYFVVQNEKFDYLLNTENEIVQIAPSEIGVPLTYARKYNIQSGDQLNVTIEGESFDFVVTERIRDAQMGSSLASSVRFVVNTEDYTKLSKLALRHESIIGFRLFNVSDINDFNDLYNAENSNMPKGGIGITLPLINMLNSIGDGFMSGVMILVGIILMSIAMLNMKFSIQSTIEEEIREIGTLKAIGIDQKSIKKLYKTKYQFITISACLFALLVVFKLVPYFLANVAQNFGLSDTSVMTVIAPFLAVSLLYFIAMFSLDKAFKLLSKMTIIEAISGKEIIRKKQKKRIPRIMSKHKNVDFSLCLNMYRSDLKSWKTFIVACFLCTLAITIPLNLLTTLSSEKFVNYVGAVSSDLRITVEYHSSLDNLIRSIETEMNNSNDIKEWHAFKVLKGKVLKGDRWITLPIETGDYSKVSIEMDTGVLPLNDRDIALSALNASRLALNIGDTLEISLDNQIIEYKVVGIYQDITNGGLTAKIADVHSNDILQYAFFVDLEDKADLYATVEDWSHKYPEAKVMRVDQLINQMLDSITATLNIAVAVIVFMSLVVIGLVSVLFMILRLHKNHSDNAILLAIGFRANTIRKIYLAKSLVSCTVGIVLGILCSLTIGEFLLSLVFSAMAFGITRLNFILHPVYLIFIGAIMPIVVVYLVVSRVTVVINKTSIMTLGHE